MGTRFVRLHFYRRQSDGERADARGKGLCEPDLHALAEKTPAAIHGFTETDPPNFSFRDPPCSFYSGTKALGEEAIAGIGQSYIWRLRIPFDEIRRRAQLSQQGAALREGL